MNHQPNLLNTLNNLAVTFNTLTALAETLKKQPFLADSHCEIITLIAASKIILAQHKFHQRLLKLPAPTPNATNPPVIPELPELTPQQQAQVAAAIKNSSFYETAWGNRYK